MHGDHVGVLRQRQRGPQADVPHHRAVDLADQEGLRGLSVRKKTGRPAGSPTGTRSAVTTRSCPAGPVEPRLRPAPPGSGPGCLMRSCDHPFAPAAASPRRGRSAHPASNGLARSPHLRPAARMRTQRRPGSSVPDGKIGEMTNPAAPPRTGEGDASLTAAQAGITAERAVAQLLSGPPAVRAEQVAERLLAIQGQDPRGARLAVRARSQGCPRPTSITRSRWTARR